MADGEDSVDRLAARTASMRISGGGDNEARSPSAWESLRLRIPNPFDAFSRGNDEAAAVEDEGMATASPRPGGRVGTMPALPQPPRYRGNTMSDRRRFILEYMAYLDAINVYVAHGGDAFAMPVGACIDMRTKIRIARFEMECPLEKVTEEMWVNYMKEAQVPSHVDYAIVDAAMNRLKMDVRLPEPESRMTKLQSDLSDVLEEFNLADLAFQHEQKRLVKYLTDALAPPPLKAMVTTQISLSVNKEYKGNVVKFCKWVTGLVRDYMVWEPMGLAAGTPPGHGGRGGGGRGGLGSGHGGAGAPSAAPPTGGGNHGAGGGRGAGGGGGGRGGNGGRGASSDGRGAGGGAAPTSDTTTYPCLKCGSTSHQVRACGSLAYPGEAAELLKTWRATRQAERAATRGHVRRVATDTGSVDRGTTAATVDGLVVTALLLDSGADTSLVARGVLDALEKGGKTVKIETIAPVALTPVGGTQFEVTRVATLSEVVLTTSAGPLMLRHLACYVEESNLELEVTVGRPIMKVLGFSTDELLVRARDSKPEWELGAAEETGTGSEIEDSAIRRVCRLQAAALDAAPLAADEKVDVERHETRTATPTMTKDALDKVIAMLETRLALAKDMGLRVEPAVRLGQILRFRLDSFRLQFGQDPPVKVEPLLVRLRPDARPTKAQVRRMPPNDREFLERHAASLLGAGLVFRNPRSRWASAPRIVRKKEQDADPTADPRMTVDERGVNERTEPMPWPMPILEVVVGELEGATVFFVLDWFRGYWQLPLHKDCQEYFTFITHRGMYTPTRVPMGATDSVAYCQQVVEEIFGDLIGNGILCWFDDILGYAKDQDELMTLLDQVLARCERYGLKLHAKKCIFFATEVKWCGRLISAAGVRHCPDRIQGLVDMQPPRTAADLQQFLCAVKWMRQSIPEYNKLTARLYETLENAMKAAGARKKSKLAKFLLSESGWTDEDDTALAAVRDALLRMVPLAHPRPDAELCLYTDASQDSWGAALTQLEPEELQLPLAQQAHRPLAFLSGKFAGASSRWATIEKEAFAIVEATRRLEYLLLRPRGFRLYTDHRNLVYIFSPHAVDSAMSRYQADKLQRWSLSLMAFQYVIEHVPGEDNVWGDLLSRWGAGPSISDRRATRVARLAVVDRVSPLQEAEFVWPSQDEIKQAQQAAQESAGGQWPDGVVREEGRDGLATRDGAVWIPESGDLQQRLCVVAHAGASGHRGARTTAKALREHFWWPSLDQDVAAFVQGCLHCMVTAGGKVPRPHGETLVATRPNEVIHFDSCSMLEGVDGMQYVLVLKDGMSGFVELIACAQATSDEGYVGLLDWFKRFGVVHQWVSDQGTHFKNQLMERLQKVLGAHHHFTTAYTPWVNGTVEVVNREMLNPFVAER